MRPIQLKLSLVSSVALLAVATSFAACGGSTSDGNANTNQDAGGGGGGNDAGSQTTSDAATDGGVIDPGTETYPADHPPLPMLKNLGGTVLGDMKLVTVTYVGNADRDTIRAFDDMIVKSPWWTTVTAGFPIHAGIGGKYVELPDDVSGKTLDNDADLKPMIQKLITAGTLPKPDANTLYAFYFPSSTTITLSGVTGCTNNGFLAYHDSGMMDVGGGTKVDTAFAVMPDCGGFDTGSASHEFIEAATDPHPQDATTWYAYNDAWFGAGGGESADLCQGRGAAKESGNDVAKSWVNEAAKASHDPCQPADPGLVYFGAALATDTVTGISDPTGGPPYSSDGYLVMKKGTTRDVEVVLFSEAKLPHDLSVVVGKRKRNATDPNAVDPIGTGVTSTLSQSTGKNGSKITLTLKVDASARTGDSVFVVRAILDANDYHSWPVVLRVQ